MGRATNLPERHSSFLKAQILGLRGNIEEKMFFRQCPLSVRWSAHDGFIGNVVLKKTSEGLADTIVKMLKGDRGMAAGRVGYLFVKPALKNFRKKTGYAGVRRRASARNKRHMHNKPREIS